MAKTTEEVLEEFDAQQARTDSREHTEPVEGDDRSDDEVTRDLLAAAGLSA